MSKKGPAHLKGAIVDKYAEIALFDAAENQRVILAAQEADRRKKAEMKAALDAQVRMQQEACLREKEEDREWVMKEQERIAVWNQEEITKIQQQKNKESTIRQQREKQLRELAALRERERQETADYENTILRQLHTEIKQECVCCPRTPRRACAHRASRLLWGSDTGPRHGSPSMDPLLIRPWIRGVACAGARASR
jgi:hypothetical protein